MERKSHYTDLLFTITLFCVFAITALIVVLFGADIYQKTSSNMDTNYTKRTAIAYIGEKVRQHNTKDSIEIGFVEGSQALIIHQELNESFYNTYIFCDNGYLKEVTMPAEQIVSLKSGQNVMQLDSIALKNTSENLLSITLTDIAQNTYSLSLYVHNQ